jgi:hypothetical protein
MGTFSCSDQIARALKASTRSFGGGGPDVDPKVKESQKQQQRPERLKF